MVNEVNINKHSPIAKTARHIRLENTPKSGLFRQATSKRKNGTGAPATRMAEAPMLRCINLVVTVAISVPGVRLYKHVTPKISNAHLIRNAIISTQSVPGTSMFRGFTSEVCRLFDEIREKLDIQIRVAPVFFIANPPLAPRLAIPITHDNLRH